MNDLKLPIKLFSWNIRFPFVFILILAGAFLLSRVIVSPDLKVIAVGLLCIAAVISAVIRQEYVVYLAIFLFFFYRNIYVVAGIYNSSNAIVMLLTIFLFARHVIGSNSVISLSKIKSNPFWITSIVIFISYVISWLIAWYKQSFGLQFHTEYLAGIFFALLMGNLLIGFVQDDSRRSLIIQKMFLLLLVGNLLVGLLSWLFPELGLVNVLIEVATGRKEGGTIMVGEGADFAMRLGGLTFFWEAYAEYLMMAVIILTGCYLSLKDRGKLMKAGIGILFLVALLELLLTNTRVPTILAAIGALAIILVHSNLTLRSRIVTIVAIGSVVFVVIWLAITSGQFTMIERFSGFTEVQKTEFGYMPIGRLGVWLPTLKHITQSGFIGSGPSFRALSSGEGIGGLSWPHNLILLILSTTGVIGLGAYAFLVYKLFKIRKAIAATADNQKYYFFKFLWIALFFFFIDTMKFGGFLRVTENYFYYMWLTIAYMFSVLNFYSVKNNYS